MKKSDSLDTSQFYAPRRQAPNALIFIVLSTFWNIIKQLWVFILFYFFSGPDFSNLFMILLSALFSGVVLLGSIIAYFRFYYYIKEDKIFIEKGVFQRSHLNMSFDRVQAINIEDNPIHRVFNTVKMRFISAGTKDSDFEIASLKKSEALALKKYILGKKKAKTLSEDHAFEALEDHIEEEVLSAPLIQLNVGQLIKIGLSQNHFRTLGIIFGAVSYLFFQVQELYKGDIYDDIYGWLGWTARQDWIIYVGVILTVLIVAILLSLIIIFSRFYGLKVFLKKDQILMRYGLFQTHEILAQTRKIQWAEWRDNPIRRWLNFKTYVLRQASAASYDESATIQFPGIYNEQIDHIKAHVFGQVNYVNSDFKLHASLVWRYTLFMAAIPALIASIGLYFLFGTPAFLCLIMIPIMYFMYQKYYESWNILVHADYLKLRYGFFTHVEKEMPWFKIQAVEYRQTPFMHRRNIGNLIFHTASGSFSIPYLHQEQAQKLMDYCLYKAESSKKNWM